MRKNNFCLTIATAVVVLIAAFLGGCLFDNSTSSDIDNSLKQELQQTFETLYDTLGIPGAIIKIRFSIGAIWQSMFGITEASAFPSGSDVTWEGPLAKATWAIEVEGYRFHSEDITVLPRQTDAYRIFKD